MAKLANTKKGQLEVSFNWIFIIIIGAVILGFILTFIFSQGKANEQKVSASVAKHFETIITSTNQKIGTVKQYTLPLLTITFTCNEQQGLYHYSVGDVKAKDTKHELIFSSPELTGQRIYTWTEKWSIPYQVATFLYITNDREHFSFVLSQAESDAEIEISSYFPKNLSTSIITWNESTGFYDNIPQASLNKQKYTYVVIQNGDDHSTLPDPEKFIATGIQENRIHIIVLQPQEFDPNKYGNVYFFNKETYSTYRDSEISAAEDTSIYFGRASLYATIFAGSKKRYECGMSKAMNRLQLVTLVQYYKTFSIDPTYISMECRSDLIGEEEPVQLWGARYYLREINKTITENDYGQAIGPILNYMDELERLNNNIVIQSECPLIY